jgi:lipoprotein-anchoring transpeptidase ErfK/SrfK
MTRRIIWGLGVLTVVLTVLVGFSGCADTRHHVIVDATTQRMIVLEDEAAIANFAVSTSKFGLGDTVGSNYTPLGELKVAQKFGSGQPSGMKFRSRIPTGEIVPPNTPGRDPIVSRILWLRGVESQNQNAYGRYIYIHGTPEESRLGQAASYGCIRMASSDIIWLHDVLGKGARVTIKGSPGPLRP